MAFLGSIPLSTPLAVHVPWLRCLEAQVSHGADHTARAQEEEETREELSSAQRNWRDRWVIFYRWKMVSFSMENGEIWWVSLWNIISNWFI